MSAADEDAAIFNTVAEQVVEMGNRAAEDHEDADLWDIASGILAGAVQFWLYARQPCGDSSCESCSEVSTAEQRMRKLRDELHEFAESSEYYHTPNDANVGTA